MEAQIVGIAAGVDPETRNSRSFRYGSVGGRPETWVTFRTGHLGYTFRFFQAGGVDAVESEFGYGRTPSLCCPPAGGRGHDGRVPGFRRIAQDRLQDFRSLQGARAGGPERSLQAAGPLCQSATAADREPRKILELVVRRLDGDVRVPAKSTIHAVLDRHGLVKRGGGP